jgi:hypothetical protein
MAKPFGFSGCLSSEELDRMTDPILGEKNIQQTGVSQIHFTTQSRSQFPGNWGCGMEKEEAFSVKGCWTKEEDEALRHLVSVFGAGKWTNIAMKLPGRTGKQCRERYVPVLAPFHRLFSGFVSSSCCSWRGLCVFSSLFPFPSEHNQPSFHSFEKEEKGRRRRKRIPSSFQPVCL